ncbi:MAG: dihydroorotate dehydrogenase [Methanomassiliicoccales archaeon]
MSDLQVEIGGLVLSNPLMLASGIMGETGGLLARMGALGPGALVTKSVGLEAREGYPNPTLIELPFGYINSMGLPNPGIGEFSGEMETAVSTGVPIVGSVFASSPGDFAELCHRMEGMGASAVELNLSCPHAEGYGMEVGTDPSAVEGIVEECVSSVDIPVFTKLTPNTEHLVEVARAVESAGGDAVVAVNTLKAMAISVDLRRPVLSHGTGGLSGPALRPVGLRCVYDLFEWIDIPIIGVGGVEDWRGALEYIMAGATAVQIGSGVGRRGLEVFRETAHGLASYLDSVEEGGIAQLVGVAHD